MRNHWLANAKEWTSPAMQDLLTISDQRSTGLSDEFCQSLCLPRCHTHTHITQTAFLKTGISCQQFVVFERTFQLICDKINQ